MQTCPGFFLKSLLESPGNLEICSVKFVDTLIYDINKQACLCLHTSTHPQSSHCLQRGVYKLCGSLAYRLDAMHGNDIAH